MKKRIKQNLSVWLRRARRVALCSAFLALLSLAALTLLESRVFAPRLTKSAEERISRRVPTVSCETPSFPSAATSSRPTTFDANELLTDVLRARDAFLAASAQKWLAASPIPANDARRRVLTGLARWNVAPEYAAPFIRDGRDAERFADAERASLGEERRRVAESSRDAANALLELDDGGESDPALEQALSFLRELGSDGANDDAPALDDAFLWTPNSAVGDPSAAAVFATADDFAPDGAVLFAATLRPVSARLLLFVALGLLPGVCAPLAFRALPALLVLLRALLAVPRAALENVATPSRLIFSRRYDPVEFLSSVRLLI